MADHRTYTRRAVLRATAGAAFAAGIADVAASAADELAYTTEDLKIDSWDGTELACTLYLPEADGPHPSMLMTHGWGGDRSEAMGPELFASNGYVVLTYDSRGFGESGGEAGVDGPREVNDTRRLISWLGRHEAVKTDQSVDGKPNPRVGMIGPSYAGGIQLNTASRDPRLNAIVPVIPWYDLVFSLEPNDVAKQGWGALLYAVGITGTRGLTSGDGRPGEEDLRNGMNEHVHRAFVEGSTVGFSDEMEAFYRVRSPVSKMDDIARNETPTLTIEGWPDTLFLPNEGIWIWEGLAERGVDSRLVLYNSGHVLELVTDPESQRAQFKAALRRGFEFVEEHVGRGVQSEIGPSRERPVEWFEVQTGEWATARSIPPRRATMMRHRLADATGAMGEQSVIVNTVAPTSTSQLSPENHDSPGSSVDFDYPVDSPYEAVGTPWFEATVWPLGAAAHLFVKFSLVSDGEASLINNQVMPFRVERDPKSPDEPVNLVGELPSFQRYLRAGDTLRLTIATTDAGFVENRESVGAVIDHSSTVTLPVIPGSELG